MIEWHTVLNIGSYIVAFLLLVDKFFNGAGKIRKEVIETYKERNEQLEGQLKGLQEQITQHSKEIAKLSGILEEKDKVILSLNQTIQNRNPELEKTLRSINDFLERIYKQGAILDHKTDEQTEMLKAQA